MDPERERHAALTAVLRLVEDANQCLAAAHAELKIRSPLLNVAFAVGAIGSAQAAVRFTGHLIRAALGHPPAPKVPIP